VTLSGPAGVGKTRLLGEFLSRVNARSFFYAAPTVHSPTGAANGAEQALAEFTAQAAMSALPRAERFRDILAPDWDTALRLLSDALDDDPRTADPAVVIIDNVSAIVTGDRGFAAAFRRTWQRSLSGKAVLVVLCGRGAASLTDMVGAGAIPLDLTPFDPAETGQVLDLDPVSAFDAYIATGGHPDIAAQWPTGAGVLDAMSAMLGRSPSVFEVRAERHFTTGWGIGSQAQKALAVTGPEERSRAWIGRVAGMPPATLDRALKQLVADGLIEVDRPRSTRESREARYRIGDPYMRLWLRWIAPHTENIARGRIDVVLAELRARWETWRRGAMQIVAREAMNRLAASGRLPGTAAVGGYWNRFEDVRIDLVGTDRDESPQAVTFVGAFKWDATAPFDHFDLGSLIAGRLQVPGVTDTTPLVAVSLAGSAVGDAVAAVLGPAELMSAWTGAA
jgi:AAA+ ATPase superfamily predicted ATPase